MPALAQAASDIIMGFFDSMQETIANIDWASIGNQIAEFLNNIDWIGVITSISGALSEMVSAALELVGGFISNADPDTLIVAALFFGSKLLPIHSISAHDGSMNIVIDGPKNLFQVDEESTAIRSVPNTLGSASYPSLFAQYYKRSGNGAKTTYGNNPMNYSLYSLKVYSSSADATGGLIREFVPCISPDGAAGLYEIVNGEFFGSYEEGKSFSPGPAI